MLKLVISGGQTGADQAGWRAAKAAGIRTDGFMPRRYMTEEGPQPSLAGLYGAREHPSSDYPARRRSNMAMTYEAGGDEGGLIVVFDAMPRRSPGTRGLYNDRDELLRAGEPFPNLVTVGLIREPNGGFRVGHDSHDSTGLAWAIDHCKAEALMIAGNRESSAPGIGAWVESYLTEVFRILRSENDHGQH